MVLTPAKRRALFNYAEARIYVWNWALSRQKKEYERTGRVLSFGRQNAELNNLKKFQGMGWLYKINNQILEQTLRDLNVSFRNFVKRRAGCPRIKKVKKNPGLGFYVLKGIKVKNSKVFIPGIGWIKFRQNKPIEHEIDFASFKFSREGQWYVILVAKLNESDQYIIADHTNSNHENQVRN